MAKFLDSHAKVVLLVDDHPFVRGRVARILVEAGYPVLTADTVPLSYLILSLHTF
jgi:CheY-like chemotaxis protein